MKIDALLKEICQEDGIFGQHVGHCYTIEYQKRGLPHMHFLLILKDADDLNTQFGIDQVTCAEISDSNAGGFAQKLYKVVSKFMIHKPCGEHNLNAPCMKDRGGVSQCSKNFPCSLVEETIVKQNEYLQYCCCANGMTVTIKHPT
jgi:hypothetical protein